MNLDSYITRNVHGRTAIDVARSRQIEELLQTAAEIPSAVPSLQVYSIRSVNIFFLDPK